MIIDLNANIKNYREKILNKKDSFTYICPKCGARYSLTRHGRYKRWIVYLGNNIFYEDRIEILRLKCSSCNSTHAILPADIVPYCIYSYSFMIQLLLEVLVNKEAVLELSKKYKISFQIIYYFLLKFKIFLSRCIFVLRTLRLIKNLLAPSAEEVIKIINDNYSGCDFQYVFFNHNKWTILMKKFLNTWPKPIYINCINS
jgi:ribosomal protein L44E